MPSCERELLDKPGYCYIMRAHICSTQTKGAHSMDLSPEEQRRTVISSRIIDAPLMMSSTRMPIRKNSSAGGAERLHADHRVDRSHRGWSLAIRFYGA